MSEKDNDTQGQKPEICGLAIESPAIIVLGLLLVSLGQSCGLLSALWAFCVFALLVLVGFVLGIVAIVKISKSNGTLGGRTLAILGIGLAVLIVIVLVPSSYPERRRAYQVVCGTNLKGLGKSMLLYENDYDGKYPTPDKWCDLLIQYGDVTKKQFRCLGNKKERCSYAMNPNCEPNSPGDTVLLFETKGGWDRSGGPELLTTENHNGYGCIILFNDGHVEFVKRERIGELKWEAGGNEKRKVKSVKP